MPKGALILISTAVNDNYVTEGQAIHSVKVPTFILLYFHAGVDYIIQINSFVNFSYL